MIDRWLRRWLTGGHKPESIGWMLATIDERYNSHVALSKLFPSKAEAEAYGKAHVMHEDYYAVEIFSDDQIHDW